jgi:lysozyme
MRMSDAGIALIKEFEGCRLTAYKCPAGVWTIGYGHTSAAGSPEVTPGMTITQQEAEDILRRDLIKYENGVIKLVNVDLTQGQFDALVDFAYNAGVGALQKSTLLKKVNAEDYDAVPNELMKWTKAGGRELAGLVRRRRAEARLWRGIEAQAPVDHSESRIEPDKPKASKSITQSKEANAAVAAGGLGTVAIVQEIMPVVKEGGSILNGLSPTVLILLVIILAAVGVWYWRKRRLDEEGA